ncbi:hypothetical protein D3C78_1135620 [compost metagenome]
MQCRADAEPVHAFGTVGDHHMLDALSVQTLRRYGLGADRHDLAVEHLGQLFSVGFDQPRPRFERSTQRLATGVECDVKPQFFQAYNQRLQPLPTHAQRQAASDHDCIVSRRNLLQSIHQGLLRRLADLRSRPVDVGDAPVAFRQFDIAAGLAWYTDEGIDKTAFGEQRFKGLQVVFAEKATDGQLMPEVGQHLRHVHAFAGGVGVHHIAAVDLAGFKARQLDGQVQRRVEGQGKNPGHYRASTNARTSLALPTAKAWRARV